ncbi:DNA-binding response regulator [Clostridium thailandense]|uniref:DNA-binding response regulator n=1 Tax=Clostridium thailandense TaxID=2794346 RepID=UPI003989A01C
MKATLDKEKVKELYLEGLNSAEIAKKIECNKETVKKCIQRNFWHLRHDHEVAVVQRRENLKATNYEANKFMSDSAFIEKNRSIYKTNANGDIVIDKNVAPVVTWDTPKRLTNENKGTTIKNPLLEHWF